VARLAFVRYNRPCSQIVLPTEKPKALEIVSAREIREGADLYEVVCFFVCFVITVSCAAAYADAM